MASKKFSKDQLGRPGFIEHALKPGTLRCCHGCCHISDKPDGTLLKNAAANHNKFVRESKTAFGGTSGGWKEMKE